MQLKINSHDEKKQLLQQIRMMLNSIEDWDNQNDTPVVSVSQNNINTPRVSEDAIEEPWPISDEKNEIATTPSIKNKKHGGKRPGAGRKKGSSVKHSEQTKLKIADTMQGNQNATKNKGEIACQTV